MSIAEGKESLDSKIAQNSPPKKRFKGKLTGGARGVLGERVVEPPKEEVLG